MNTVDNETEFSIYSYIDGMADKLYKQYSFLQLDKNDFNDVIINKMKSNIVLKGKSQEKIEKAISRSLLLAVRGYLDDIRLNSKDVFIIILDDYVNILFNQNISSKKNLDSFSKFLNRYSIDLTKEECDLLIDNNEVLNNCFQKLLVTYLSDVKNEQFFVYFSKNVKKLIESYALKNNIDISKVLNYDPTNYSMRNGSEAEYYRIIDSIPMLSKEEENELGLKIVEGDTNAYNKLVMHNMKFVKYIAKNYRGRGYSFQDLIQEGNIGLMDAAKRYVPHKDSNFATFAKYCIIAAIKKALYDNSRTISIEKSTLIKYYKVINAKKNYIKEHDKDPSIDELVVITGFTQKEVEYLLSLDYKIISLDEYLVEEGKTERSYYIPNKQDNVDDVVIDKALINDLNSYLYSGLLNDRELLVLTYKYGLDGNEPLSTKEIAEKLNMSEFSITFMEFNALDKFYNNEEFRKKMAGYVDASSDYHEFIRTAKNVDDPKENVEKDTIDIRDLVKEYLSIERPSDELDKYKEYGIISEIEEQVLKYRFYDKMTQESIGELLGQARPRISYIEANALNKLISSNGFRKSIDQFVEKVSKYYKIIDDVDNKLFSTLSESKVTTIHEYMAKSETIDSLPHYREKGVITEKDLTILQYVYGIGLSKQKVADILGTSRPNISKLTSRALDKLYNDDEFRINMIQSSDIVVEYHEKKNENQEVTPKKVNVRDVIKEYLSIEKPFKLDNNLERNILSRREYQVLECLYYTNMSIADTADYLGISIPSVQSVLNSAVDKLYNNLRFRTIIIDFIYKSGYYEIVDEEVLNKTNDEKSFTAEEFIATDEAIWNYSSYLDDAIITQREYDVLNYYYGENLTQKAIAEKLNIERPAVSQLLKYALRKLSNSISFKKDMQKYYETYGNIYKVVNSRELYFKKKNEELKHE